MTNETDEMVSDRAEWIVTSCPWCNSDKAIVEDPELPDSPRFITGECPVCERAFEYDQYADFFEEEQD